MKAAARAAAAAALALAFSSGAFAHGDAGGGVDLHEQLAQARRDTLALRDVQAAQAAGYAEFRDAQGTACIEHASQGAMGVHYLNGGLIDAVVDAARPEALVYEPRGDGKLELVALEYIVFQGAWDALHPQPPTLFGHPFHLVREPNRYGVPAFYELHVWLWRHNPGNLFDDWNPRVNCR